MLKQYLKKKQYEKIKRYLKGRSRYLQNIYYDSNSDDVKKRCISQIAILGEVLTFIKHEEDSK